MKKSKRRAAPARRMRRSSPQEMAEVLVSCLRTLRSGPDEPPRSLPVPARELVRIKPSDLDAALRPYGLGVYIVSNSGGVVTLGFNATAAWYGQEAAA